MPDRLIAAIVIIAAGIGLYLAFTRWQLWRARHIPLDVAGRDPGKYLILYFTSPTCAVCKSVQEPTLRTVESKLGDKLQVIKVDTTERMDLAQRWQIMTVPTTLIFDGTDQLRLQNLGLAREGKLLKQLTDLGCTPSVALAT